MVEWRGDGMEWGNEEERDCRRSTWHSWTQVEVDFSVAIPELLSICEHCHVRRCTAEYETHGGRCTVAYRHPPGVPHRFPDLWSEPVGRKLRRPVS